MIVYEVKYTIEKEVTVTIEVNDAILNQRFDELGEITSDKDFKGSCDPRWGIEQIAFGSFNMWGANVFEDIDNEVIVNRTICRKE